MFTFLGGLKGGQRVWVAGEADDIQSREFGEKIVSPCHSCLWRNKVNLGEMEGGMEGGREGREKGREEERRGRERGESEEREERDSEGGRNRTAGGENTTLFSTRMSCFLRSSTT